MSEKETSPREVEPTAAKSTTREVEPNTVKAMPPPPRPDEESTAVKRALLFMYWVAALLGSDYVFTLSSGPNYFTRIDTGGAFDMRDSEPTKAANTQFSNAWTVWAAGQFVGSVLSRALSGALGWRPALFVYVVLMLAGNLMYVLADPSVAGSIRLAIAGKFVDGLGCGATALGIGYIPTVSAHPKVASWRMSTFRLFVSVGMVVATVPHEALHGDDQGRRGGVVLRRVILPLPFQNSRVLVLYKSLNSRQGGSKISVNRGSLTGAPSTT